MSDEKQGSTQTSPNGPGLQAGIDWVGKHWPRVRLAHEGVMVDKIQRQTRIVEVLARNTMTGKTDNTKGLPIEGEEGDDMGVKIGDEVHNYYPTLPAEPPPSTPEKAAGLPTWAKYLASGLAGGSIGAGVLAGTAALTGSNEPPAAVVEPVDAEPAGDRWTEYTIEKWIPELPE